MKRWGPWTQGQLNRLRYEVRGYFRIYYSELRRLIASHEDAEFPYWFRGGREIHTSACTDGVLVTHSPYDVETLSFPEREDSFSFHLGPVLEDRSVGELVREGYSPTFPDGSRLEVMPAYSPREDFGYYVRRWPAYEGHSAGDGYELGSISEWTRLDAASMSSLHVWRDRRSARCDAWETVKPYVEGDDPPVPRPL
jgi:hypothetical protein